MIRPVRYAEILDDPNSEKLLLEYAEECSIPELGYASPQRELYELLEKSGGFQAFSVYEGEVLVGFATVLIYVLPHYGQKIATTESIFVLKGNSGGIELMAHIERYAAEQGCLAFLYSAPVGRRFDALLSISKGYHHTNNVYLRKLA